MSNILTDIKMVGKMEQDIKEYISKKIKIYMHKNNLTVRDLAIQVELGVAIIYRILRCENYNIDSLQKLLNHLNLRIYLSKNNTDEGE
jgi:predicted transcriptional regulator